MKFFVLRRASSALLGICRRCPELVGQAGEDAERKNMLVKIAHELRNPLGAIHFAARTLRRAPGGDAGQRALDVLDRQLSVLRRLIEDLSALARAEVSLRLLNVTSFDVQSSTRAALYGLQADALRDRQTLTLVFPETPVLLEADQDRFEQMLMNLVGNALKYSPGGNVTVSICVQGPVLDIRIDDDGVGIAPESLESVFELFAREDLGRKRPEGLGVGLAVVRELAKAHDGGVEAYSSGKGLGSVFTLRLPLKALPRQWSPQSFGAGARVH